MLRTLPALLPPAHAYTVHIALICVQGFNVGGLLLSGSVTSGVLASLSLKRWKHHQGSQLFTTAAAGTQLEYRSRPACSVERLLHTDSLHMQLHTCTPSA
jgi:hypothetical protein